MNELNNLDSLPLVMTVADVSKALGISRVNAYTLVKSKGFPAARVTDRRIVVFRKKFWEWLEEKSREQV